MVYGYNCRRDLRKQKRRNVLIQWKEAAKDTDIDKERFWIQMKRDLCKNKYKETYGYR